MVQPISENIFDSQEDELIRRCQNSDSQAMEQIVVQYQNQVYNIAYGMLGNREDAQDITQDVFLRVWQKVGQFQFKSRFSTWLYRIASNLCTNEIRRRQRRRTSPMEMDDAQPWMPQDPATPERNVLLNEQRELLQQALDLLKPKYREVLVLREIESLSYDEIAQVIGCSTGRVKSRLHEARMQLNKILKKQER